MGAQRRRLVAEAVHGAEHRVHDAGREVAGLGQKVAERAALDDVAVVEQHVVGRFGPGGGDQRRGLGEADGRVRPVLVVVKVVDEHVEVGGFQQPQPYGAGAPGRADHRRSG